MMKVKFRKPPGMARQAEAIRRSIEAHVKSQLIPALTEFHQSILETPVYTGRTLVNFRWSTGGPITDTRGAIANPRLPGETSTMEIGAEPRRSANAEVINQEFAAVLAQIRRNPFSDVYLNNNVKNFSDVEYGVYARNEGQESRTPPGGMTRRGETALTSIMEGLIRRVA